MKKKGKQDSILQSRNLLVITSFKISYNEHEQQLRLMMDEKILEKTLEKFSKIINRLILASFSIDFILVPFHS